MNMKKLTAMLLMLALTISMTACTSRENPSNESSSSSQTESGSSGFDNSGSASNQSSSSTPDAELMPWVTPHEAAERFAEALMTSNATGLAKVIGVSDVELYRSWTQVDFLDIQIKTLFEDAQTGHYEFTFVVDKSDNPVFPVGTIKRTVVAQLDDRGDGSAVRISQFYNEDVFTFEQNPYDRELPGYEAYELVNNYISLMVTYEFAAASAIPIEEITDYTIIRLATEYDFERAQFSVEEVNQKALELFDISSFDGTGTAYYDAEENVYVLLGRGGNYRFIQTFSPELDSSGVYKIDVGFYADPLCTQQVRKIRYTLNKEKTGLKFISAVPV